MINVYKYVRSLYIHSFKHNVFAWACNVHYMNVSCPINSGYISLNMYQETCNHVSLQERMLSRLR